MAQHAESVVRRTIDIASHRFDAQPLIGKAVVSSGAILRHGACPMGGPCDEYPPGALEPW